MNYQSFMQGYFPAEFKKALVIPLLKKGNRNEVDNYRQISLLCSLSKLYEKVVATRILNYLEANNLICNNQHGFRKNRSIETAAYHFLNHVYSSIDSNNFVISVFFDLSKAFDTVSSDFLYTKLAGLGFPNNVLKWLKSYMDGRCMTVKYDSILSSEHDVRLGVPQGSVLGPLLFVLFANDLSEHLKNCHVTMFADDTTITIAGPTLDDALAKVSEVIDEFTSWCERNRLILNTSKSVSMKFYNRKNNIPDEINHIDGIAMSHDVKFLGTLLDESLNWDLHINSVCKKLNTAFFAIKQMKCCVGKQSLLSVYFAMAYSHISLNIMSWGCGRDFNRIFVAQKRILRLIFEMDYRDSCKPVFIRESLLSVPSIYILKCVNYVRNNLASFETNASVHSYCTRHCDQLRVPTHKTTKYKNSPIYNAIVLYNKLPISIKESKSDKIFYNKTKIFLTDRCYYSQQEYLADIVS